MPRYRDVMPRYRIVPERSRLQARATSSVHPIDVDTTGVEGWFEIALDGGRIDTTVAPAGRVEIDVDRLRTGNPLYDRELDRRLDTRKFPRVRGDVRAIRAADDGYAVRGDLTFHGETRPVEGRVRLRVVDERTIEVAGEQTIDMREFGLEPPRFLMLKVHPEVQVYGHVVAEREPE